MNEKDDGASLEVEKNQYNEAEASLSDAMVVDKLLRNLRYLVKVECLLRKQ